MSLSEKLAALSQLCGPNPDPITVKRKWRFLGIVPVSQFDSEISVANDGDWWRVMLCAKRGPIIGADFRKDGGPSMVERDFIAWKYGEKKWGLANPSDAAGIRDRIETSIELAHRQFFADTRVVKPAPPNDI